MGKLNSQVWFEGMATEGKLILFSASFSSWRLSERKFTVLFLCGYSMPLLELIPQIFHQCVDDDLVYGTGCKGTREVEETREKGL